MRDVLRPETADHLTPLGARKPHDIHAPTAEGRPKVGMVALFWRWGLAIVALAGLCIFILNFADLRFFADILATADPAWLAVAFAVQAATYFCTAALWRQVLAGAGIVIPIRDLFGLALVELFANQAVPSGGMSGNLIVVRGLNRRGVPASIGATALIAATLSYYVAYLFVALSAFMLLWHMNRFSNAWAALLIAFVTVVLTSAGVVLAVAVSRGRFIPSFARDYRPVARIVDLLLKVHVDMLQSNRLVVETIALQSAIFLIDSATLWCAARSIHLMISPEAAFISFVFASVAATVSPIPLGLGSFEGTCVAMLVFFGGRLEASLAATLILRGFTFWLPMAPGLWMIRREAGYLPRYTSLPISKEQDDESNGS